MEIKEFQSAIEAILFASGEPVSVDRLAEVLDLNKATAVKLADSLAERLDTEGSGICVMKMDDKYQMCSRHEYGAYIRKVMDIRRNVPLSPAAMEVLAIVAYNQPVTKAFVEQIRGVDCSGVLSSLTSKNLIEEKGRLELPGRPLLYGTTANFLRCFGITSVDYLPPLPSQSAEEETEPDPQDEEDQK